MSKIVKLGVIGLSSGNGHPYSWSAIFNGYDPVYMEECGFPVIPRYLENQIFPDDTIVEAKVTHVWTQDRKLSEHIARAAFIDNVVDCASDLVGNVDAVLLARDDANNHLKMAVPFLEAGLPIYIDKPLALEVSDAQSILNLQQYPGQVFSCSAMRYAPELRLTDTQQKKLGKIGSIFAFTPKDWDKYGVHAIEAVLGLIPSGSRVVRSSNWRVGERVTLHAEFDNQIEVHIHALGNVSGPLGLRVIGSQGWCDLEFSDTFRAFRGALLDFVGGVIRRDVRITREHMMSVVELVELGRCQ